ncbi:MAG: hypothetical protein ACOX02_01800 [Acholeplasmatales bacterium]
MKKQNSSKIVLYAYACLFPVGSILFLFYGIVFLTRPQEIANTILMVICFIGSLVFLIMSPYAIMVVRQLLKALEEVSNDKGKENEDERFL